MSRDVETETISSITERLLREGRGGPFHLSDGVYFWRELDGIHLVISDPNTIDVDSEGVPDEHVLRHFIFDKSSWASAVASTSVEGETGTTFRITEALIGP